MSAFIAQHFIEIFFGLISAGLLAFCRYIYTQMKMYQKLAEEKKVSERYIEIILASYRFRLIQLCQSFLKQGYMTSGQYEQLVEFFKVYAGLGGNGQAKEYYERTLKLPLKD